MDWNLRACTGGLGASPQELAQMNRVSQKFGLALSPADAVMLAERRAESLRETGRIEFDGGTLRKLALAFCDSPYIQPSDWAETLADLQSVFYRLKNEGGDRLGDEELMHAMAARFNGAAGGSLDVLESVPLKELFRSERKTEAPYDN